MEGTTLLVPKHGRRFQVGPWECHSAQQLHERLTSTKQQQLPGTAGGLNFQHIVADVTDLHKDPANDGAVIQVGQVLFCAVLALRHVQCACFVADAQSYWVSNGLQTCHAVLRPTYHVGCAGGVSAKCPGDGGAKHHTRSGHHTVWRRSITFTQPYCHPRREPEAVPVVSCRYAFDNTQGPACALACPAATAFRNYFCVPGGQVGGGSESVSLAATLLNISGSARS